MTALVAAVSDDLEYSAGYVERENLMRRVEIWIGLD